MRGRGLYYARIHRADPVNLGAVKKCRGLLNGFRQSGYEIDIAWYGSEGVVLNETVICRFPLSSDSGAWHNILFHHLAFDAVLSRKLDFRRYDFIFIRYPLAHPGFLLFLKKARAANPSIRIFLEVPTYPYNKEMSGFLRKMQYWLDRQCNRFLKKYVDWTVHYGLFKELFGIPSISLRNGVDAEAFPVSKSVNQPGLLRLIAVGNWSYWHGLDRLIAGLGNYYSQPSHPVRVELTVAGGGREVGKYHRLVEELRLTSCVRFLPPVEGAALDALFNEADVAIGSLGLFRIGLETASPLKHREYSIRGLPFILAVKDTSFPDELPWVCRFTASEEPLSILEIVAFIKGLQQRDIHDTIRQYAIRHLSWSEILKPVLEKLPSAHEG